MTQEKKKLLLQDLCARLPYKVIVDYGYNAFDVYNGYHVKHGSKCILKCYLLDVFMSPRQNEKGEYIKPYLRPMSSMTEEEIIEFNNIPSTKNYTIIENDLPWDVAHYKQIDWLNKKMFDYRGLIPRGCAIAVTEDNNPYKD